MYISKHFEGTNTLFEYINCMVFILHYISEGNIVLYCFTAIITSYFSNFKLQDTTLCWRLNQWIETTKNPKCWSVQQTFFSLLTLINSWPLRFILWLFGGPILKLGNTELNNQAIYQVVTKLHLNSKIMLTQCCISINNLSINVYIIYNNALVTSDILLQNGYFYFKYS